jgi:hypothetical protein
MRLKDKIVNIMKKFDNDVMMVKSTSSIKKFCDEWDIDINKFTRKTLDSAETYSLGDFCKNFNIHYDDIKIELLGADGSIIYTNIKELVSDDGIEINATIKINKNNKLSISEVTVKKIKNTLMSEVFHKNIDYHKKPTIINKVREALEESNDFGFGLDCTKLELFINNEISEERFLELIVEIC